MMLRPDCPHRVANALERQQISVRTPSGPRRVPAYAVLRAATAVVAGAIAATALAAPAAADASDDYPIPNRILKTTCTVDQYMAAARDVEPVYYQRYMIDYHNRPVDVENAARDRIYWFFSLDYAGRRQYSEDTATNVLRTDGNPLGQLGQAVLQQQGRRRARHRRLRAVPAQRSERLRRLRTQRSARRRENPDIVGLYMNHRLGRSCPASAKTQIQALNRTQPHLAGVPDATGHAGAGQRRLHAQPNLEPVRRPGTGYRQGHRLAVFPTPRPRIPGLPQEN
jgi:hypothetical protein